jgi:hypothetical protein
MLTLPRQRLVGLGDYKQTDLAVNRNLNLLWMINIDVLKLLCQ